MPNHITNILRIEASEELTAQIKSDIKSVDEEGETRHIDFNKILPMPESLRITSGSTTSNGIAILQYRAGDDTEIRKIMEYAWGKEFDTPEDLIEHMLVKGLANLEEAQKALDNERLYGCRDWYGWSTDNWGTKWNAYSTNDTDTDEVSFETAWSNPYPVIVALSAKYPEAVFRLRFADEDFGHNVGEYSLKSGYVIEENIPEGGSEEALELAADITGYEDYITDRLYDIESESVDELEEWEKKYISIAYGKENLQEYPKVVLDYMLELAIADENYEFAERIKNTIACNDED
jgi:hypothetical protein